MLCCIDIIIGILLIVFVICNNIISGTDVTYSIPIIIIGLLFIAYHFLKEYTGNKKYLIIIKKIILSLFCISLFIFMLIESLIIGYPKINKENTDYIIILGTELKNGHNISKILRDRLNTAVKSVYTDGNNGYIVVSGGKGTDEDTTEAEAMERYLIDQGVPKNKIIKECKSGNIYENLKYSKLLIENHSGKTMENLSIKIVTTDFQALRSSLIASNLGYKVVRLSTSSTVFYLVPAYYIVEVFSLIESLFIC